MVFAVYWGELQRHKRVVLLLVGLMVAQIVIGAAIIYGGGLAQTRGYIQTISDRAVDDITYKNGVWDTARYDSDPEIPGNYRMYIITKDGFVIDRWRPIAGYLDTSDFRQLMSYHSPSTVHTITGQDWRILSLPVVHAGNTVGVVTVGRLLSFPTEPGVILVDQELHDSATTLLKNLTVQDNTPDASAINVRSIPFTISFQIVDQYNRILLKRDTANSVDRLPNYIDPSYIADNLERQSIKIIQANGIGERYLVNSTPLKDPEGAPIGTIIVARTIDPFVDLMNNFIVIGTLTGALLLIAGLIMLMRLGEPASNNYDAQSPLLQADEIHSINFLKDKCLIHINDQEIAVSYATNQYYMCRALFSRPTKKWETDELVEQFGIDHGIEAWRKLYDAMSSINKKCHVVMEPNLILASNKTYRINPELLPVVSKTNGK